MLRSVYNEPLMAKVGFVSLGCPKNLVDSEVMLGLLAREGHTITSDQSQADIIVVNTCGFIESAKQESVDTILEMAQQKTAGNCKRLIVAGCLVERYRHEISEEIAEVDAVIGTNELPNILHLCKDLEGPVAVPPVFEGREGYLYSDSDPRVLTTARHTAYVKIAEGCDHPCTFCVIPQMRGFFRSRPRESVIREVRGLAESGVREVNLIGQDTTMFGWDRGDRNGLARLIEELDEIDGIEWVRFLYAYPNNIYDELLRVMARVPSACNYIDVPLQHAASPVLKRMKRGGNRHSLTHLIGKIRALVPGVAIRTTMIVGFPGETEEDFEELMDFVEEARFERLGVFPYSDEESAASQELGAKVDPEVAMSRRDQVMKRQSQISRQANQKLVGTRKTVLLDGPARESDLLWEGRLSTQAPEIDGVVYLTDGLDDESRPGELQEVLITEAHDYDLVGQVIP